MAKYRAALVAVLALACVYMVEAGSARTKDVDPFESLDMTEVGELLEEASTVKAADTAWLAERDCPLVCGDSCECKNPGARPQAACEAQCQQCLFQGVPCGSVAVEPKPAAPLKGKLIKPKDLPVPKIEGRENSRPTPVPLASATIKPLAATPPPTAKPKFTEVLKPKPAPRPTPTPVPPTDGRVADSARFAQTMKPSAPRPRPTPIPEPRPEQQARFKEEGADKEEKDNETQPAGASGEVSKQKVTPRLYSHTYPFSNSIHGAALETERLKQKLRQVLNLQQQLLSIVRRDHEARQAASVLPSILGPVGPGPAGIPLPPPYNPMAMHAEGVGQYHEPSALRAPFTRALHGIMGTRQAFSRVPASKHHRVLDSIVTDLEELVDWAHHQRHRDGGDYLTEERVDDLLRHALYTSRTVSLQDEGLYHPYV